VRAELAAELAGSGEVIRVRVRLDDVVDAHAALGGERDVAIELLEVRIDEHRRARDVATDQVRQATAVTDLLEEHGARSLAHPAPPDREQNEHDEPERCSRI